MALCVLQNVVRTGLVGQSEWHCAYCKMLLELAWWDRVSGTVRTAK